ncbi:MAG: prolyl oligopeptidase family serine peptidase, partial [Gammaproteobacteria bacterium]|nr:prolyl oligopeptidase family serine peptidase [Gammaproteobacteria bacterium]
MNKQPSIILFSVLFALTTSCSNEPDVKTKSTQAPTIQPATDNQITTVDYPQTAKGEVVDNYFGSEVADPYRWLEDDMSQETGEWVKSQNTTTFGYLKNIPYREELKNRLESLWNYEKITAPYKEGDYTYFKKNDGLQNQYVVYRQKEGQEVEVFLDPNTFSEDGTTSLASLSFSKDGSIAAYSISEGGSDWRKIIIIDVETKEQLEAPLKDVKFSGMSWRGNEGFYYSSYDKPEGSELSAKTDQHKLYFHKLGQPQSDDKVIFGATEEQKRRYVGGTVTEDDLYLLISGHVSTSGNELYLQDLTQPDSPLVTILDDTNSDTYVIENVDNKLYLVTNRDAPNKKIVTVNVENPTPENWVDFIPESENVLLPSTGGGYFFTEYMVDATSKVFQYDYDGKLIKEIELPGYGSASSLSGKKEDKTLYYSFTNYKTPSTIFSYDVDKGESAVYRNSGAKFDPENYVSTQIFYTSKDGTKIPMIITHKKDIVLDGKNPTILYGYGGFNISLTPSFSITNAVWMESGGIYAVPNIRGGGEYGKKWHKAGTKLLKQNVFDDFIA